MSPDDVTLGEVDRRVGRLEQRVDSGFKELKEEIARLSFVPAAVYAADRAGDAHRLAALEADLALESRDRRAAEDNARHRSFQARLALVVAALGIPASILAGVVTANLVN